MGNIPPIQRVSRNSFAPGKVILSGEYAVIYGFAGIAIPSSIGANVVFEEDPAYKRIEIFWEGTGGGQTWLSYAEKVVALCQKQKRTTLHGRIFIHSDLPLGKGMGSSSALLIALTRAVLGTDTREAALLIEDIVNSGHSGFDFATIWENTPILFRKGDTPKHIDLPFKLLQEAVLIDTGLPSESTTELVAWMRGRKAGVDEPLKMIGNCTDRIVQGEPLDLVMRDHSKAQVALGVVPPDVRELIAAIEEIGGSAKVIGAGSRTGRAGMVLALGNQDEIQNVADTRSMPTMFL
jgi:mevalonate kinase